MGSPHHPSLNPMPMQLSLPHNHPLPLDHFNQLMSCLSIKTTNNEEVIYVRIPIHPWTLVAWNEMTKTPILPLWLDLSTHHRHRRNFSGHAWAQWVVCNLYGLDLLVSDIHVTGFGVGKPHVEVGGAMCKKNIIILFLRQSLQLSPLVGWRKRLKCLTLIGLETKSGKIKMYGPKWKKVKM